ncbi:MAG TPA: multicopper oxidase family protein [Anaerolineales bacterium]
MTLKQKLPNLIRGITGNVSDPFLREIASFAGALVTETVTLGDGDVFELHAAPIRMRIGENTVKMLAYNGSIPGPTLVVKQGSQVIVNFTNHMDIETTVHWHGLRLDNRFDGVPEGEHQGMQLPIPPGGGFAYQLRFPDPGMFWYHPHIREDYTQEHGLYGNILVVPEGPDYWAPVNREITLVLDDILIQRGKVAQFSQSESFMTAMGRYGNVMLVNGTTQYDLTVPIGEVVRLYLTNTANVRTFNFCIPGARMKYVGADNGRVEREVFVHEVMISPSERVILEVLFEEAGKYAIEHRTPHKSYTLGRVTVSDQPVNPSYRNQFLQLRQDEALRAERARLEADFDRIPDKTIALIGEMPGMKHGDGHHHVEAIEWEDNMLMHNRMTTPHNMFWKIVDQETGAANHDILWVFKTEDRVKIRIVNDPHSDHPMQHPFHFHGERFLVLSHDGVRNDNLVWKDTVLVQAGETVDIMLETSNPGLWMAHCHIAEHVEGGMMFNFLVTENGSEEMPAPSQRHHG